MVSEIHENSKRYNELMEKILEVVQRLNKAVDGVEHARLKKPDVRKESVLECDNGDDLFIFHSQTTNQSFSEIE